MTEDPRMRLTLDDCRIPTPLSEEMRAVREARAVIPADTKRHPSGCPDADWCRGNRCCYWDCEGAEDHGPEDGR